MFSSTETKRAAGLAFFVLGALLGSSASAQQATRERFEYRVDWGEARVAAVSLLRSCPTSKGTPLRLRAHSLGFAEQVHPFDIRLDSVTDGQGRPRVARTRIDEQGATRRYRTRFDGARIEVDTHTPKKRVQRRLELAGELHDLLSWVHALRERPFQAGIQHTFHVWDGWKWSRIAAAIGARERVWTPVGIFGAHKVVLSRTRLHHGGPQLGTPRREAEALGVLWVEPTSRNVVAMDFEAPIGVARIRLTRVSRRACH